MITEAWTANDSIDIGTGYISLDLLSDEELVRLAQLETPSAGDILVHRYRGRVELLANQFFLKGAEREDLVQEGMIGLSQAIRGFRVESRLRFDNFATLCVRRSMQLAVRSACRQKHLTLNLASGLATFTTDYIDQCQHGHVQRNRFASGGLQELLDRCLEATSVLTTLEKAVVDGYVEGESNDEMCRRLCCGPKAIDNAFQRAKRKIARIVANNK